MLERIIRKDEIMIEVQRKKEGFRIFGDIFEEELDLILVKFGEFGGNKQLICFRKLERYI